VTGCDVWTAPDVDGWGEDLRTLGPDYFFSLNRYVFCATRPLWRGGRRRRSPTDLANASHHPM